MRCGDNRAASRRVRSPTRPPHRARWGELIKLATRPLDWVGRPDRSTIVKQRNLKRVGTPANTPKVFALGDSRRPKNVVDNVVNPVILITPILSRLPGLQDSAFLVPLYGW